MTTETDIQDGNRQIKDLTDRDIGWIYSLSKWGQWEDSKIARHFALSERDARKVIDNVVPPHGTVEKNLRGHKRLGRDPSPERSEKKPRKRRSDARFATPADRQAAYRARLQEKRRTGTHLPSPDRVTDSPAPVDEEFSVTAVDIP